MMNKYEIVKKMAYDLNTSEMPDEPLETMLDRIIEECESDQGYKQGFTDGILFIKACLTGQFIDDTEVNDQQRQGQDKKISLSSKNILFIKFRKFIIEVQQKLLPNKDL